MVSGEHVKVQAAVVQNSHVDEVRRTAMNDPPGPINMLVRPPE